MKYKCNTGCLESVQLEDHMKQQQQLQQRFQFIQKQYTQQNYNNIFCDLSIYKIS